MIYNYGRGELSPNQPLSSPGYISVWQTIIVVDWKAGILDPTESKIEEPRAKYRPWDAIIESLSQVVCRPLLRSCTQDVFARIVPSRLADYPRIRINQCPN